MLRAVFLTIVALSAFCFVLVGMVSTGTVIALAAGQIEMTEITTTLQGIVDHSNYYLTGLGATTALATLRTMRPFVVTYIRDWVIDLAKNQTWLHDMIRGQVQTQISEELK